MSALTHSFAGSAPAVADAHAASIPAVVGLQEIGLPAPVAYTPQTWGWAVLALLALGVVVWIGMALVRHYRAQAYRRAALQELAQIEAASRDPALAPVALAGLPALVKRVALAVAPREQIAGLSEETWLAWLDASWRKGSFTQGPGRLLASVAYARQAPAPDDAQALIRLVRGWIGHHHARV